MWRSTGTRLIQCVRKDDNDNPTRLLNPLENRAGSRPQLSVVEEKMMNETLSRASVRGLALEPGT